MRQLILANAFMSMTIIAYNSAFCSVQINGDQEKLVTELPSSVVSEQSVQENTTASERNTGVLCIEERIAKLERNSEAHIKPIIVHPWMNRAISWAHEGELNEGHHKNKFDIGLKAIAGAFDNKFEPKSGSDPRPDIRIVIYKDYHSWPFDE